MEPTVSPARAERTQRRKLAFVPTWPVLLSVLLLVGCVAYFMLFTG